MEAKEVKSVDDLLVHSMQDKEQPVQTVPIQHKEEPDAPADSHDSANDPEPNDLTPNDPEPQSESPEPRAATKAENPVEDKTEEDGSPIDEYGNPVAKPRTYTEAEVQKMIRDRLSRGRHAEPQTPPSPTVTPSPQASPQANPAESGEDWETQLEQFVERTIEKRQSRSQQEQYQRQEAQRQSEFEERFSSGMNRYSDFHDVVSGKPINDTMMIATRALPDPAAFVYGASRLHPQELSRIHQLTDPIAVTAEIGRLHERMVKEKKALSSAPKPVEAPKGDMPNRGTDRPPIDQLIYLHAKHKFGKR